MCIDNHNKINTDIKHDGSMVDDWPEELTDRVVTFGEYEGEGVVEKKTCSIPVAVMDWAVELSAPRFLDTRAFLGTV